jgi:prepilin-type N-terminal cleavage/methylation domain-containing protein
MNLMGKCNNQKGFTLVEIIAVLVILGILAAVAVPRYINLQTNAKIRAVDAGISELNGRENLIWANLKIGTTQFASDGALDAAVWGEMDSDISLGADYTWDPANLPSGGGGGGGALIFQNGTAITLTRGSATLNKPAHWGKQ